MRSSFLCAWVLVLFFFPLLAAPATAQQADHAANASYRIISLDDNNSDIRGQSLRLMGTRTLTPWAGLEARLSYQFALNNTMRDAVDRNWSNYQAVLAGVSGYFEPLWFRTGGVGHRLRLSIGPSVRYQKRENPVLLAYPTAHEEDRLPSDAAFDGYYQERLEGSDLEQEGVYTLYTTEESGVQLGTRLGTSYQLHIDRFIVGGDIDFHLIGNDQMTGYGLFVGMEW